MPLEEKTINIPFVGSLAEHKNEFLAEMPDLIEAEGVVVDKSGVLSKRKGVAAASPFEFLPSPEGGQGQPSRAIVRNDELILLGSKGPVGYSSAQNNGHLYNEGGVVPGVLSVDDAPFVDVASTVVDGVLYAAYKDSFNSINWFVRELATGTVLYGPSFVVSSAHANSPVLVAPFAGSTGGPYVMIAYVSSGGTLNLYVADTTTPTAAPTFVTSSVSGLTTSVNPMLIQMAGQEATDEVYIYKYTSGGAHAVSSYDENGFVANVTSTLVSAPSSGLAMDIYVTSAVSPTVVIGFVDVTGAIELATYDGSLGSENTNVSVTTGIPTSDERLAVGVDTSGNIIAAASGTQAETSALGPPSNLEVATSKLKVARCDYALVLDSTTVTGGYRVGGRPVSGGIQNPSPIFFVDKAPQEGIDLVVFDDATDTFAPGTIPRYSEVTLDPHGYAVSILTDGAGDIHLWPLFRYHHDKYGFTHRSTTYNALANTVYFSAQLSTAEDDDATRVSTSFYEIDLSHTKYIATEELAGRVFLAGGYCGAFDGYVSAENTPHNAPVVVGVSNSGTAATYGAGAKNKVSFVFTWYDATGREHRSAASPPLVLDNILNGGSNTKTSCNIKLLSPYNFSPLLNKALVDSGLNTEMYLEVYISENLASNALGRSFMIHRLKVRNLVQAPPNDHLIMFDLAESGILINIFWEDKARKALYEETGELASEPIPTLTAIRASKDRLWAIPSEEPTTIWYTKPLVQGHSPEWNANLVLTSPVSRTPFTALAEMDDKVIIFSKEAIFYTAGDGPNASGTGGAFLTPRRIPSPDGTEELSSVVSIPNGVLFRGTRGFYLLQRNLSVVFIGGPVEDLLSGKTIVESVHVPKDSTVWFLVPGGQATVGYNYEEGVWTTHTLTSLPDVVAGALWNDELLRVGFLDGVTQDVTLFEDDPTSFLLVSPAVTTSWIKLAGLQGFKRLYELQVLMDYFSGGFKLQVAYDYDDTWVDTWTIPQGTAPLTAPGRHRLQFVPSRQKIQSFKLRITEDKTGVSFVDGAWANILGIAVRAGLLPQPYKFIPEANKA